MMLLHFSLFLQMGQTFQQKNIPEERYESNSSAEITSDTSSFDRETHTDSTGNKTSTASILLTEAISGDMNASDVNFDNISLYSITPAYENENLTDDWNISDVYSTTSDGISSEDDWYITDENSDNDTLVMSPTDSNVTSADDWDMTDMYFVSLSVEDMPEASPAGGDEGSTYTSIEGSLETTPLDTNEFTETFKISVAEAKTDLTPPNKDKCIDIEDEQNAKSSSFQDGRPTKSSSSQPSPLSPSITKLLELITGQDKFSGWKSYNADQLLDKAMPRSNFSLLLKTITQKPDTGSSSVDLAQVNESPVIIGDHSMLLTPERNPLSFDRELTHMMNAIKDISKINLSRHGLFPSAVPGWGLLGLDLTEMLPTRPSVLKPNIIRTSSSATTMASVEPPEVTPKAPGLSDRHHQTEAPGSVCQKLPELQTLCPQISELEHQCWVGIISREKCSQVQEARPMCFDLADLEKVCSATKPTETTLPVPLPSSVDETVPKTRFMSPGYFRDSDFGSQLFEDYDLEDKSHGKPEVTAKDTQTVSIALPALKDAGNITLEDAYMKTLYSRLPMLLKKLLPDQCSPNCGVFFFFNKFYFDSYETDH